MTELDKLLIRSPQIPEGVWINPPSVRKNGGNGKMASEAISSSKKLEVKQGFFEHLEMEEKELHSKL